MPVSLCDWSPGACSGWTGSSVVGVHCWVSKGWGININTPGRVCMFGCILGWWLHAF